MTITDPGFVSFTTNQKYAEDWADKKVAYGKGPAWTIHATMPAGMNALKRLVQFSRKPLSCADAIAASKTGRAGARGSAT
jgi:hypothetical protein